MGFGSIMRLEEVVVVVWLVLVVEEGWVVVVVTREAVQVAVEVGLGRMNPHQIAMVGVRVEQPEVDPGLESLVRLLAREAEVVVSVEVAHQQEEVA